MRKSFTRSDHSLRSRALIAGAGVASAAAFRAWARARYDRALQGQVVLITGGSRGLGLAVAREFARRGAKLVLCARNRVPLEEARRELEEGGGEVMTEVCDVGDRDAVNRLVDAATARFGRIDVLVNNAGVMTVGPIQTQTLEDFGEAMDVMFWGVVHPTLAVLPQMLARGDGRIVNITSIGGKVSFPHLLPYNSAKFAAVGFSEGLHAELAKDGVSVVTVVPGFMRTGSYLNAVFKGKHRLEYGWFSVGGGLPGASITAERAARRIVDAAARRTSELMITPQAHLAARVTGLLPALTARTLGIVNRLLPRPGGVGTDRMIGKESRTLVSSVLAKPGEWAGRRLNQFAGGREKLAG